MDASRREGGFSKVDSRLVASDRAKRLIVAVTNNHIFLIVRIIVSIFLQIGDKFIALSLVDAIEQGLLYRDILLNIVQIFGRNSLWSLRVSIEVKTILVC